MQEALTFSTVNLIVSLITIILVGINFFRKPQVRMGDEIKDLEGRLQSHQDCNSLETRQLRDALMDLKKNDLHELNIRQDQFANLIIEQTKELARLNGQQEIIVALLKKSIQ
ncbi:MAG: hypothetical protein COY66_05020 [Candidatus Kerfeldbacteria bacterium CG_4_10_14_0_8_um_filter_42_10]|uniref:Uncharacterized protein n=1 Tax=Candidatus Kerfeldbacteria bacterium CG_4_10_14_0_8_um_filter_42_10 TaxID=2014248 RepID=A0A2M7RHQ4_9BACT|nr:MAG: hypothetical protein COY66_05020 [Candidatus Kerfeldbacteria bacterium CG_4_10_14_0_8_um_filter_42_10]